MNTRSLAAFAIGIGAIALIVAGVLFVQRGSRIRVTGQVLKVRTVPLDDGSSVAVADFRVQNPGKLIVVVRSVRMFVEDASGKRTEGQTVSEVDARRLFEALPVLGQKYNDTLVVRDKIPSGASLDRMVAARFEMPVDKLDSRKQVYIQIEDVDGPVSELAGK
jgi:hypothetical protein